MAGCPFSTRRGFLGVAGGALVATGAAAATPPLRGNPTTDTKIDQHGPNSREPFYGAHQAGIRTPQQQHTVFAALDITTDSTADLIATLKQWTDASARMAEGSTARPLTDSPTQAPADSGEAYQLPPRRLTLTFGFGSGLFEKDGKDRFGLRARRPAALIDLPLFNGDQLDPKYCGGDLCIQACADDELVAFHAIRQLARIASGNDAAAGYGGKTAGATVAHGAKKGTAELRWMQSGFLPDSPDGATPRNLLGFKDGTQNPGSPYPAEVVGGRTIGNGSFDEVVWVDSEGPDWMRGGSYMVARRIRLALEHWDRTELDFQEEVIGRRKTSGAPLTGGDEFAPLDLDATDKDGNLIIAENAHVRLGAASANGGARIMRRAYSYNDGLSFVAERWPPWRQGLEYDAGLLFIAYQRDPRAGFVKIFEPMSKLDLLNQYATHVGSAVFACCGGVERGEYIGQKLFVGS